MTNLAAAVEQVRKDVQEAKDSSIVPHLVLTHIDHLETILAELGRGAGEPKHVFEIPVDRYDWTEDGMEIIPKNQSGPNEYMKYDDYEKLYNTRPPVAGLAELTDAGLFALFDVMDIAWVCATSPAEGRKDVAKAAREFLGKVDG